jgi:hypothetical protein
MDLKKDQTLYNSPEEKGKTLKSHVNIFVLIGVLLALLVCIRFANLGVRWITNTAELTSNPLSESVDYTFLGFSSQKAAEEKCPEIKGKRGKDTNASAAAYFDLLHPAKFVVRNNNKKSNVSVDLGRVLVMAEPGLSTFTYTLSGMIEKERDGNKVQVALENPMLSDLYSPTPPEPGTIFMSFVEKTPENANFLHVPYMIYFFLPLVLIIVYTIYSSKAVLTAFFYYPGLFLLFDYKEAFVNGPFCWLFKPLNFNFTDPRIPLFAVGLVAIFFLLGVFGLLNWKKQEDRYKERLIIFTFLLLPLFLRF